jgi:WD40 repeat protein
VAKLCGEHQEHAYEALRLTTHGSQGVQCTWTTDDHIIAIGTSRNTLIAVNILTATRVASFQKGQQRFSHYFTPSLSHVAVYGDPVAPAIELQVCGGNSFAFLEGHTSEVCCCCLSNDGAIALSCGREGQLFLWSITYSSTGEAHVAKQQLLTHSSDTTVKRCCLAAEAEVAASGDAQGHINFWSIGGAAAELLTSVKPFANGVYSLTISADGMLAAAGSKAGHVVLMQVDLGHVIDLPSVHAESCKVKACTISPDKSKLLTGGDDCKAVLWEVSTRQALLVMSEHSRPIRGCCFSSDGARMATCGEDCLLVVYDVVLLCQQDKVLTPYQLIHAPHSAAGTSSSSGRPYGLDSSSICKADGQGVDELHISGDAAAASNSAGETYGAAASGGAGGRGWSPEHKADRILAYSPTGRILQACTSAGDLLAVGSASCSSSNLGQGNAYLTRVRVNDGDRLLGCQVAEGGQWERYSRKLPTSFLESVICTEQSEQLVLLEAGNSTAHVAVPGSKPDAKVACCSFDADAVATAKRDGSISILSCAGICGMTDAVDPAWDRPPPLSAKVGGLGFVG